MAETAGKTLPVGRRELDWLAGALGLHALPERPALAGVLAKLATLRRRAWPRGRTIGREGGDSSDFFILYAGGAVVEKDGRRVGELARGDFFGRTGFLGAPERAARVRAGEGCELLCMDGAELDELVRRVPGLEALMRDVARDRARKLWGGAAY